MPSRWFCRVRGQEVGPVGLPEMVEMIRTGTLEEDNPVRRDGSPQWIPAGEIAGLFRAAGKEAAEPVLPDPQAEPEPAPRSADAAAPTPEQPSRLGKHRVLWFGVALLVMATVALGVWRWSSRSTPRFPEPGLGSPKRAQEEKELDDSIAAFSKVVGGTKNVQTEEFSFTSARRVRGIVVSYKCHSQSESNCNENTVELMLRRAGEVIGESLDSYESQTDWGDITEVGFWHSEEFADISLVAGDRVDLTITVGAGDYMNWVSEIRICPLKKGAPYPDDRGFHGSL